MDAVFGNLEQFGAEVVYPYRWLFAVLALAALAAVFFVAYRKRWDRVLLRHKVATAVIVIPLLGMGIPAGYYTLSPLWERSTLVEAAPDFDRTSLDAAGIATPTAEPEVSATPTVEVEVSATSPAAPTESPSATLASEDGDQGAALRAFGVWSGADDFHFARGEVLIIETEPGVFILRVENFSVRNGPDLFVYLSPDADGFADGA